MQRKVLIYMYCSLGFQGFGLATFVLVCAMFPAKQRVFAGLLCQNFWSLGMMVLALLMFLISNWRYLQLLLSLLGLVSVPLYWCVHAQAWYHKYIFSSFTFTAVLLYPLWFTTKLCVLPSLFLLQIEVFLPGCYVTAVHIV